jgi:hypothetical protein
MKIRLPVRSAIFKRCTGGLVVRWVTTGESPLLYVFCTFLLLDLSLLLVSVHIPDVSIKCGIPLFLEAFAFVYALKACKLFLELQETIQGEHKGYKKD